MKAPFRPSPSTTRDAAFVAGLFVSSRALVAIVALVAPLLFKSGDRFVGKITDVGWQRYVNLWDVGWYGQVAVEGYRFSPTGDGNVAFFPLLPLLLRAFRFVGIDFVAAGLLLSAVCLLASLALILRLVERETASRPTAELTTSLVAFSPAAAWFSLGLTESLFLFLTLALATAASARRWIWMAVFGVLAGLTRPNGFLLVVPAGVLAWGSLRAAIAARQWKTTAAVSVAAGGPVLGHLAFVSYLQIAFGNWRAAQIAAETRWFNGLRFTWEEVARRVPGMRLQLFDTPLGYVEHIAWSWLFVVTLAIVAAIGLWEHRARAWHAWQLGAFLLFHAFVYQGGTPAGPVARYAAVVPAFYVGVALLARERAWLRSSALAWSAVALAIQSALIFAGYHIN